ncbi:MAG: 50S ribosomal protein L18 [Deltaproteobacteria bacterium RBG_13_49_15]|nr:MAG: 50S ribosomal protein L18 [Deltaproteobacteria bacterium RBG_13_49_15]
MGYSNQKKQARLKRKKSIRKKISGSPVRPRLCVFRSARHIYAQLVDDSSGHILAAASTLEKPVKENTELNKKAKKAAYIGKLIAQRALEKGIKTIVFDRNGFLYHGRVKAVSEGAREAGLLF